MMLETERVMCDLQMVLSTAQSLQMLFLQVMQKARSGSLGCVEQAAALRWSAGAAAAPEARRYCLAPQLLERETFKGVSGRPCASFHAMIWARMDTLGNSVLLPMAWLVVGEVECDASHSVIDALSYVKPSAATTGSSITSQEKVMSQS
jgi:hypothetical protein